MKKRLQSLGLWALALLLWSCHDHDHDHHGHGAKSHKGHKDEHKGEIKLSSAALKQVRLETYKVRLRALSAVQIAAVGRVTLPPSRISRVGSRVEGRILRWYVSLGQRVKRGQALALLDSPAVGRARARYLRRKALHRIAQIESKRTARLKRIGLASSKRLLAAKTAEKRAQIDLGAARAQLRILGVSPPTQAKLQQLTGRFVLRAPSAGEVTLLSSSLGAWVSPQSAIMQIEDRRQVWVLLELYARDVPQVKIGQKVHLYGPGLHHHLEGAISFLASRYDHGAQTLEARVVLSNKGEKLRPNQFLYARIEAGPQAAKKTPQKALLIPEDAVQRMGQGQVVFVLGSKPGHYKVRTVVTVEAPKGYLRVLYGLKPQEKIVVKGSFVLKSELMRAALEGGHGHAH